MPAPRRVFLDWDEPVLPRAASWLVREMGPDLSDVVVALPGSRAARRIELHLARALPRGAVPPRLVGFGHLPDELLLPDLPVAGRLVRTLLWREALQGLPPARRSLLLRRPPDESDAGAWLALGEEVRAVHGELARDGHAFADVAPVAHRLGGEDEGHRWDVLAEARAAYLARLADLGRQDPHEGRRAALAAGRIADGKRVVLVGVAELNALVCGLLERLGERATVLVAAPETLADSFDELGAVRPDAWSEREIALPADAWTLVDRPDEQADAVAEWIARRAADRRPEEIVVGVPDPEVVPHLQRRLDECGAKARDARGTPVAHTPPARCLEALAAHLAAPSFATFAALLRHPDVPDALRRAGASLPDDLLARLDAYQTAHVPDALPARWPGSAKDPDRPATLSAHEALEHLLREFSAPPRPAAAWARPLAELLGALWGHLELDDQREDQRVLAGALAALGDALRELAALSSDAGAPLPAVEAVRLALRSVATARVPPPADADAIELLGWLELPLDDAPALAVTGVNEGGVPEPLPRFALLPDGLRRALHLPDDRQRLARDAYALSLLAARPRDLLLVTGRRNAAGDPLRPSRLLFLAPEEVAVQRAARFAEPPASARPAEAALVAPPPRPLPRLPSPPPILRLRTTDFALYLRSPYRFYLERVAGLRRARDDARELDPAAFGSLAHETLEVLGGDGLPQDAEALGALLTRRVDELVAQRCGARPAPAVVLQAENLKYRLRAFAGWHARQLRDGWRVACVEWPNADGQPLETEAGRVLVTGRIDRIDVHPTSGAWRILDYKTGEKGHNPVRTHGGHDGKAWTDLQLPLYRHLVTPLVPELRALGARAERPQLGYVVLPHVAPHEAAFWARAPWTPAEEDAALDEARRVAACILRGEFDELADFGDDDELLAAIAGLGLLGTAEDDEDEEEDE
jgi:ATP-dependent helicase/nuclease subunit B